jgi:hypothetical protein
MVSLYEILHIYFYLFDPNNEITFWDEIVNKYDNKILYYSNKIIHLYKYNSLDNHKNLCFEHDTDLIPLSEIYSNKPLFVYKQSNERDDVDVKLYDNDILNKDSFIRFIEYHLDNQSHY